MSLNVGSLTRANSTGSNRSAKIAVIDALYPIKPRTYMYVKPDWKAIYGDVRTVKNRSSELIPKTTNTAVKYWLSNLEIYMTAYENILLTLEKIELAQIDEDVIQYLKQMENRGILTNHENRIKLETYLNRLIEYRVTLHDRLLLQRESIWLVRMMQDNVALIKKLDETTIRFFKDIFSENSSKLHVIHENIKTVATIWKSAQYVAMDEKLCIEFAEYTQTKMTIHKPTQREAKLNYFGSAFMKLIDHIKNIDASLIEMRDKINTELTNGTGLLERILKEKSVAGPNSPHAKIKNLLISIKH